jgi:hypothetical protein
MCDGDKNVYPGVSKKLASTNCKKFIINKLTNHPKKKNDSIRKKNDQKIIWM